MPHQKKPKDGSAYFAIEGELTIYRAAEMSSQAEALQQLLEFFQVGGGTAEARPTIALARPLQTSTSFSVSEYI